MSDSTYGAARKFAESQFLEKLRKSTDSVVVALFAVLTVAVFSQVVAK